MARVTVQYIADHLGISKFAVSRALTGKPGVSDETRLQVMKTAARMGYVPKPKFKRQANAVEIIFHDHQVSHREVWMDVQGGAQQEAARLGFATAIRWTSDPSLPARLKPTSAGLILVGPHEASMIEAAKATGLPCVRVGPLLQRLDTIDQIGQADREASAAVAEHLLNLGHRRFVYAHGRPGYPGRIERLQSFSEVVLQHEGTTLREMYFPEDDKPGEFRSTVETMIRERFEPTTFFCGNDGVAVTVISELMRMGLRVPEDISVVGFADYPIATQIAPRLTTVRAPHREMGIAAVRILLSRIGRFGPRNDLPPHRLLLIGELIVRESTAKAANVSWISSLRAA